MQKLQRQVAQVGELQRELIQAAREQVYKVTQAVAQQALNLEITQQQVVEVQGAPSNCSLT
jgi:hypothetical protein